FVPLFVAFSFGLSMGAWSAAFSKSAIVERQHVDSRRGQPRREVLPVLALLIALVQQQDSRPRLTRCEIGRFQFYPVGCRKIDVSLGDRSVLRDAHSRAREGCG